MLVQSKLWYVLDEHNQFIFHRQASAAFLLAEKLREDELADILVATLLQTSGSCTRYISLYAWLCRYKQPATSSRP
jgi:hypothetical protein